VCFTCEDWFEREEDDESGLESEICVYHFKKFKGKSRWIYE